MPQLISNLAAALANVPNGIGFVSQAGHADASTNTLAIFNNAGVLSYIDDNGNVTAIGGGSGYSASWNALTNGGTISASFANGSIYRGPNSDPMAAWTQTLPNADDVTTGKWLRIVNSTAYDLTLSAGNALADDIIQGDSNTSSIVVAAGDSVELSCNGVDSWYVANTSATGGGGEWTFDTHNNLFSTGAGNGTMSGNDNIFSGIQCGNDTTIGYQNVSIGSQAGFALESGNKNTGLGSGSLYNNIAGNDNVAIGFYAGGNIDGDNNICIGSGVTGNSGESNIARYGGNLHTDSYIAGIVHSSKGFQASEQSAPSAPGAGQGAIVYCLTGGALCYINSANVPYTIATLEGPQTFTDTLSVEGQINGETFLMTGPGASEIQDDLVVSGVIEAAAFSTALVTKTDADDPYTALASDSTIVANPAVATTLNVNLPTAAGITGRIYTFKLVGLGTLVIDGSGSETIDGATTKTLATQFLTCTIQSDGSNWIIIGN